MKQYLSYDEVRAAVAQGVRDRLIPDLLIRWPHLRAFKLYGIPRGGVPIALMVKEVLDGAAAYGMPFSARIVGDPHSAHVLCDDLIDSGSTRDRYLAKRNVGQPPAIFFAAYDKTGMPPGERPWLVFPWEKEEETPGEDIILRLFQLIGEDPKRPGLLETPKRVLKAWSEWASGYEMDPAAVLKTFEDGAEGANELVIVHNIPIVSKCEHHLADITGHAHVGYIPNGRIVGLSKLPRLVDIFARRLQVQERLTNQVADSLVEHLAPKGVGVLIRAAHACMSSRGVRIHGSQTTTSALRGVLFDKPEARAEFFSLCAMAERGDR